MLLMTYNSRIIIDRNEEEVRFQKKDLSLELVIVVTGDGNGSKTGFFPFHWRLTTKRFRLTNRVKTGTKENPRSNKEF